MFDRLKQLGIIDANKIQTFFESFCCDVNNKNCMYGECQRCNNFKVTSTQNDPTWHYLWVTETVERPGAKGLMYKVKIVLKKNNMWDTRTHS